MWELKKKKRCSIEGCESIHYGKGYCEIHYGRWKRHGDPEKLLINEHGKGYVGRDGYRTLTINYKPILEHRLVMQRRLGRELTSEEEIHHIDGDRLNNNISNLRLFPNKSEHARYHALRRKGRKKKKRSEIIGINRNKLLLALYEMQLYIENIEPNKEKPAIYEKILRLVETVQAKTE